MRNASPTAAAAGLLVAVAMGACGRTAGESPGGAPRPDATAAASPVPAAGDSARRRYTEADVRFLQRMIGHHAQALTMTALVPERSEREDIRRLAERIEITQRDEMALMRRWLTARGEEVPSPGTEHEHHHGGGGGASMPGMLTQEEMARLTAAGGAEFDRLFLEYMIRHHEGALTMVAELFGTQGAGQEPEIFRLASDVDADQRAEIARMRAVLAAPPTGSPPR